MLPVEARHLGFLKSQIAGSPGFGYDIGFFAWLQLGDFRIPRKRWLYVYIFGVPFGDCKNHGSYEFLGVFPVIFLPSSRQVSVG